MRTRLKLLRNVLLAAGIVAALAFGAKEATGCLTCTQPPPTSCKYQGDPDVFCEELCQEYDCFTGQCRTGPDYCLCPEK